jgi:uncharacterized protein YjbI with pentapeptide repeats
VFKDAKIEDGHTYRFRDTFAVNQILHTVEIAKETPLYAPDLRGISLENAQLNGADLRNANLSGVCLRGVRLREAMLEYANLSGADLSYCDLRGAHLENANLVGAILYPAETIGAKFYGAKFAPGSDAADYARLLVKKRLRRCLLRPRFKRCGILCLSIKNTVVGIVAMGRV